jgi:hypothetical protein
MSPPKKLPQATIMDSCKRNVGIFPSGYIIQMKPWMSQDIARAKSLGRLINENLGE